MVVKSLVLSGTSASGAEELLPKQIHSVPRSVFMVLIDSRSLERECLVRCVDMMYPAVDIKGYATISDWPRECPRDQILLYSIGARNADTPEVAAELKRIVAETSPSPVVVLGDSEDFRQTIAVFDCGAHGYFSQSIGLDTLVEVAKLSSSGGVFLPMASINALRNAFVGMPKSMPPPEASFTGRQLAVGDALRRGKSNKTIAYELSLCESTVKVHIRNIMKKLKASNRTEAAFKLNIVCFDGPPQVM